MRMIMCMFCVVANGRPSITLQFIPTVESFVAFADPRIH